MIKFFRHIRQKLLTENKPALSAGKFSPPERRSRAGKYFLYAIGEIFLVVIGILIALQINNWTSQQKQKQLQVVYLNRLINDLDHDLANIEFAETEITENQAVISNFVNTISTGQDKDQLLNSMVAYFEKGWIITEFVPSTNTYTDLSQTGNMKVIRNTDLVNDVISYYSYMVQIENSNNINKSWITPIDQAVAKETAAFEIDPNTSSLFSAKDKIDTVKNLLLQKELLERDAAGHYWINNSLKGNLEAIKGITEDLKQAVQNELKILGK